MQNEIIIYQDNTSSTSLEVRIENETVWLTQTQIVALFDSSKANVSEHIKNIYDTKELEEKSTVRKIRTVQIEGERKVTRELLHYSLDMIISIGYRVNSKRGTQFRIWANKILKDFLLKGYAVNQRVERIEHDVHKIKNEIEDIRLQLKTNLPHNEGILYDGQIFDAYVFVSEMIKSAKSSIVLIDNYIDETVLVLLSKRAKKVSCTIFTHKQSKELKLDIQKHSEQYPSIYVKTFNKAHDRFLIIDNETVYHIGASLKDLGKKWFAFSKMKINPQEIMSRLSK